MARCSSTTSLRLAARQRETGILGVHKIGNHVSIGTNATILPVTICDHVVIGAGAVVTKDITEPGIYAGNPARLLRRCRSKARIQSRHVRPSNSRTVADFSAPSINTNENTHLLTCTPNT